MLYLRKSKRSIRRLFIHHYGDAPPKGTNVRTIRRMHMEDRNFSDIGYHGVIMPDGEFQIGRDIDRMGAHALANGNNRGSIGIMLVAGLKKGAEYTVPTKAQLKTLREIIAEQEAHYPGLETLGHRDVAATLCPGFDLHYWRRTGRLRK